MNLKTAMVLAAGLGTRMRPLTQHTPKPLVQVGTKPLLQYCLDAVKAAGICNIVVNVHHLPDQIIDYLMGEKDQDIDLKISDERDQLLDSGGGIVKALPDLGPHPFLLLNADTFWFEDKKQPRHNLSVLMDIYDEEKMDILLMLVPISQTTGYTGTGDFNIDFDGRLTRHQCENPDALVYAGVAILHPKIFDKIPDRKFSLNKCFDISIKARRLYGHVMSGHWVTVGTVEAISEAETVIKTFEEANS